MPKQFDANFIPKKMVTPTPSGKRRVKKPMGILAVITIFIVVLSVVIFVVVSIVRAGIRASINDKMTQISAVREQLDQKKLEDMRDLGLRLSAAMELMNDHISVTPLFKLLNEHALPGVQFDTISFSQDSKESNLFIAEISGKALDYMTIAQQSSIFGKNEHLKTHLFSNFTLGGDNRVSFNLRIVLPQNAVKYIESFKVDTTYFGDFISEYDDEVNLLFDPENVPKTIPENIPVELN